MDERFQAKVRSVDPDECWVWTGATRRGYPLYWAEGRQGGAHRFIYEQTFGAIPDGMQIDHLCRNRRCVNPIHLEAVTQQENLRRGREARQMKVKGTRVRELRQAQDLTREQLAVKAGISARTLARVELNEGPTNDSTLAVLALALGCNVSDFTDEEPVAA